MFNIGTGEMILILVVALLLLGPQRLPEVAKGIGKFMREFRRQTDEVRGMVEREFYKMDEHVGPLNKMLNEPLEDKSAEPSQTLAKTEPAAPVGAVPREPKPLTMEPGAPPIHSGAKPNDS